MQRNVFLKTLGMGLLCPVIPPGLPDSAHTSFFGPKQGKLDRYRGLRSICFEPSGFFRIEKSDRWWLVTPEGSAFLSFGINHISLPYLTRSYNVDYWRTEFGANDVGDEDFLKGFREKAYKDIDLFGMNTIGTHANKDMLGELSIPYTVGLFFVKNSYWMEPTSESFVDVFSSSFRSHCEQIAENVALPRRNDPYLIGYTFTNVPILTDLDADAHGMVPWYIPQPNMPTWPRSLRNLPGDAPGKKVFVDLIQERYPGISEFNRTYHTDFSSFKGLMEKENWSPMLKDDSIEDSSDNLAFLLKIYDRYYHVATESLRKFDPNHLVFGDPLNANTGVPDDVIKLVSRYTDVLPYQLYKIYNEHEPLLDHWLELTEKPVFNTDFAFVVPYEQMPQPGGALCPDQETRSKRFLEFATRAFSRPDFLGWHWCGWVDGWAAWPRQKLRQHSGLQDPFGRYHHPMPETMAWFGSRLYDFGQGKTKPVLYEGDH